MEERRLVCPRGHSFDVARSGYINLLQPQDRRSRQPGIAALAVAARRRLHDRGVTEPLLHAIAECLIRLESDVVLDAGCGEGFYLGTLAAPDRLEAHGVDISIPAVDAAARRYPGVEWIVANADRFLPYADASFSIVLSITGRMNPAEFRRILRGRDACWSLLPRPTISIELREQAVTAWTERSRPSLRDFTAVNRRRVTTIADLDSHPCKTYCYRSTGRCDLSR